MLSKHLELRDFSAIFANSWGGVEEYSDRMHRDAHLFQTAQKLHKITQHLKLDSNARNEDNALSIMAYGQDWIADGGYATHIREL